MQQKIVIKTIYVSVNVVDIQLNINLIVINALGFFMPKRKASGADGGAYSAPP